MSQGATIKLEELKSRISQDLERHEKSADRTIPFRAVAYQGKPDWIEAENNTIEVNGKSFKAVEAVSFLHMRRYFSSQPESLYAFVTTCPAHEVPDDIKSRLFKQSIREWDSTKALLIEFGARQADPRIRLDSMRARTLLACKPLEGFPPVPSGILDAGTFWDFLNRYWLGLPTGFPTPRQLLAGPWEPKWENLPEELDALRQEALAYLESREPLSGFLVRFGLTMNRMGINDVRQELLVATLCGETIFRKDAPEHRDLGRAEERFISKYGLTQVKGIGLEAGTEKLATMVKELSEESKAYLATLPDSQQRTILSKSDNLLDSLGARNFGSWSNTIPIGFEKGLEQFSTAIISNNVDAAANQLEALKKHRMGSLDKNRIRKAEMVFRLMCWLNTVPSVIRNFGEAAKHYRDESSFVDWARITILGGDTNPAFGKCIQNISSKALERREDENREFAMLLQKSFSPKMIHSHGKWAVIEEALAKVLPKKAGNNRFPLLILVMDGLPWAITHELLREFEDKAGFTLRAPKGSPEPFPALVISTIPSVTECARYSLLTGGVGRGDRHGEKKGFASHFELTSYCNAAKPPLLFHQADIEDVGKVEVNPQVLEALQDGSWKVVGVVLNTIDDDLAKDTLVHDNWNLERFRILLTLLKACQSSGRSVMLCSDHGHIRSTHTHGEKAPSVESGERWHRGEPRDNELRFEGPREQECFGPITVPWTEKLQYKVKKNGYHGGISPQEMIAPFAFLAYQETELDGYIEMHLPSPNWWDGSPKSQVDQKRSTTISNEGSLNNPDPQISLFDQEIPSPAETPSWISNLLKSEIYLNNKKRMGRRLPGDTLIVSALEALDSADHHRIPASILARHLNLPKVRIRGFVSQLRNLLNEDSYEVIAFTEEGDQIVMNKKLLLTQFDLEK